MKNNQKYFPDRGYSSPKRTCHECPKPAFADKQLHRIGLFYQGELTLEKCVNCGMNFERIYLVNA